MGMILEGLSLTEARVWAPPAVVCALPAVGGCAERPTLSGLFLGFPRSKLKRLLICKLAFACGKIDQIQPALGAIEGIRSCIQKLFCLLRRQGEARVAAPRTVTPALCWSWFQHQQCRAGHTCLANSQPIEGPIHAQQPTEQACRWAEPGKRVGLGPEGNGSRVSGRASTAETWRPRRVKPLCLVWALGVFQGGLDSGEGPTTEGSSAGRWPLKIRGRESIGGSCFLGAHSGSLGRVEGGTWALSIGSMYPGARF